MNTVDELQKIADSVRATAKVSDNLLERRAKLIDALRVGGFVAQIVTDEKSHTGRAFAVKEMSDHYRINYRCGYGPRNYAPVVLIKK